MKKILIVLFLASFFCPVYARKWEDAAAPFRVLMKINVPNEYAYADLRTLCLPVTPQNGFRVFDEQGKPLRFHHFDGNRLLLPPQQKPQIIAIYFGYKKRQPYQQFAPEKDKLKIPFDFKLRQRDVSKAYPEDLKRWNDLSARKRHSRFSRLLREKTKRFNLLKNDLLFRNHYTELKDLLSGIPVKTFSGYAYTVFLRYQQYCRDVEAERLIDCENALFHNFNNRKAGHDAARIFFTRRPFDTDRYLVTIFFGRFITPRDGTYEFLVNTNSTRLLRINGKTVLRLFGETQAKDTAAIGTTDRVSVKLKQGVADFEFIYSKGPITNWAAVSVKRPGDKHFSLLSDEDFAPAVPLETISLEGKNGVYPIVMRNDSLALYTGKHESCLLDEYAVSGTFRRTWKLDGKRLDGRYAAFVLKNLQQPELTLIPDKESGLLPLPVIRCKRNGAKGPVQPDLSMKIWSPLFLYDDEYGSAELEMSSRLPLSFYAKLSTAVSRKNPCFQENPDEPVSFTSMPMEHEDRYAQDVILKRSVRIDGEKFVEPLTVDFALGIPDMIFDRSGLHICRTGNLPEIHPGTDGLYDGLGRKMLIILHRKTLHEVRSWELLKRIRHEVEQPKKFLVAAESFGSFQEDLKKQAEKNNVKLDFIAWNKSTQPSGSPALNSVPAFLKAIEKTNADTFAIIPIHAGGRGTFGDREELNILALLIEKALMNPNIHNILLATPLPSLSAPNDDLFRENLRKLRREKGIRFIELEALCRNFSGSPETFGTKDISRSTLPVMKSREIAELLILEMKRK